MEYDDDWFKLSRRIFLSSVWEEQAATRIVWISLLNLAQLPENRKHGSGVVLITRGNLLRIANVTPAEFDTAIAALTKPDPTSRSNPGEPRLEVLPDGRGYRIPSFELYHDAESFERWHAQRVAAGRARARRARRTQGGLFETSDDDDPSRQGETSERSALTNSTCQESSRTVSESERSALTNPATAGAPLDVLTSPPARRRKRQRQTLTYSADVPSAVDASTTRDFAWSRDACDLWIAAYEGTPPGGVIGRSLRPLVVKFGWPAVREAWSRYLHDTDGRFASAPRFASTYGQWSKPARNRTLDNNRDVLAQFVKESKRDAES